MIKTIQNSNPIFPIFRKTNQYSAVAFINTIGSFFINRHFVGYIYIFIMTVIYSTGIIQAQGVHSGTIIGVWRTPDTLVVIADTRESMISTKGHNKTNKIIKVNDSIYITFAGIVYDPLSHFALSDIVNPLLRKIKNVEAGIKLISDSIGVNIKKATIIHKLKKDTLWNSNVTICIIGRENGGTTMGFQRITFPKYKAMEDFSSPHIQSYFIGAQDTSKIFIQFPPIDYFPKYVTSHFANRFPTLREFCEMMISGIKFNPEIASLPFDIVTITKDKITYAEKYKCD